MIKVIEKKKKKSLPVTESQYTAKAGASFCGAWLEPSFRSEYIRVIPPDERITIDPVSDWNRYDLSRKNADMVLSTRTAKYGGL